jgi:putative DNA methylase
MKPKKKLIEVALPLEAINKASAREKSIRHGHPSSLHLWWSRKPTATARAVIFAQMIDDPSAHPDIFPTEKAQQKERQRLFRIIENLVLWENTANQKLLQEARDELSKSWRYTCAEHADHLNAKNLFDPQRLPGFHDPFAGGGSIPVEAQRLGMQTYASDLNPVAVVINKAMIEIPPKFSNRKPVNPKALKDKELFTKTWKGAEGIAEDVRYYGKWMRDEAEKRIGNLFPKVNVTPGLVRLRPELKKYLGQKLIVIAWLWAGTVKSPNPAFRKVDVPLASTFMLSTKVGKEAYVEPVIENGNYYFTVKLGKPKDVEGAKNGTKLARANFSCIMSGAPISGDYIKAEAKAGRKGAKLMAIVAECGRGRIYLPPTDEMEVVARQAKPGWKPEGRLVEDGRAFTPTLYGMLNWSDLFTPRQLVALTNLSDLVQEARVQIKRDAVVGMGDDGQALRAGGVMATAYADAVSVYLALGVSKLTDYNGSLVQWSRSRDQAVHVFGRQALPMVWDYVEINPFAGAAGDLTTSLDGICRTIEGCDAAGLGEAVMADAQNQTIS